MFLSHSEFNMNSIKTDEAIFMEMILAPDVAPEMARNQWMRGPNLLERLNCLNKGNIINTMKHFMMMVLYNYVARKQYFAGRRRVEAVVACGVTSFNSGVSPTSDVIK